MSCRGTKTRSAGRRIPCHWFDARNSLSGPKSPTRCGIATLGERGGMPCFGQGFRPYTFIPCPLWLQPGMFGELTRLGEQASGGRQRRRQR